MPKTAITERKISAEVEFKVNGSEQCQIKELKGDENNCEFLPSEVVTCLYEYPLKLVFPNSVSSGCCQWVYPITFGGGLVEGDEVNISFKIGQKCCILTTTMSFPKVYCCENAIDAQQHMKYSIDSGALVLVLPDPVVCFKNASFHQTQTFHLTPDANLVLLDWFTSGRYSRGERWAFSKFKSVSSIFINDELEFREAQNIQNTPFIKIESAMKSFNILGTCMVMGCYLEFLYSSILTQLGKCRGYGEKPKKDLLLAVSPLYRKETPSKVFGCIVRFAATSVPEAIRKIEELLTPLFSIIGDNPFANK